VACLVVAVVEVHLVVVDSFVEELEHQMLEVQMDLAYLVVVAVIEDRLVVEGNLACLACLVVVGFAVVPYRLQVLELVPYGLLALMANLAVVVVEGNLVVVAVVAEEDSLAVGVTLLHTIRVIVCATLLWCLLKMSFRTNWRTAIVSLNCDNAAVIHGGLELGRILM